MTKGQLRVLTSLVYLTSKHGPRTFEDIVTTSGRSREWCARNIAWLVVNGYVSVDKNDPNKVLTPVVVAEEETPIGV